MPNSTPRLDPYRTALSFLRSLVGRDDITTDPFVHRSNAGHDEVPIEALDALRA